MSKSADGGADQGGVLAGAYSSAHEFVRDRLEESDRALTPSDLAESYGCTNGHIRGCLNDLREEGEVKRVGRGLYERVSEGEEVQEWEPESTGGAATEDSEDSPEGSDADDQSGGSDTLGDQTAEDYEEQRATTEHIESDGDFETDDEEGQSEVGTGIPLEVAYVALGIVVIALIVMHLREKQSSNEGGQSEDEEEPVQASRGEVELIE